MNTKIIEIIRTVNNGNRNYPLMPETFMPSNFEMQPKIGSHRLPTHRRSYEFFFLIPSFLKTKFDNTVTMVAVRQ